MDDDPLDSDDHSTCSEVATIAHLHSQAAIVQNIKNLIPSFLTCNPPTTPSGMTMFSSSLDDSL
jgi:hypothetical protein